MQPAAGTFGPTYDPKFDEKRIASQRDRVKEFMLEASASGVWLTLDEIGRGTGDPIASISAQLRHLRKAAFGSHTVLKRPRGERLHGLYEYFVLPAGSEVKAAEPN